MTIPHLRKEYRRAALTEEDVNPDPVVQFERWFHEALEADCPEPTAMTLATVSPLGRPSARIVLLKAFDAHGFVFYTNYQSRKGRDLSSNPQASLLLYWVLLERQVRIEGTTEEVAPAQSDAYFASRPVGSRLGAWASPQSQRVADRAWLEREFASAQARYGDAVTIPRPPHWGGYRVVPDRVEFWQGRQSRLHDRIVYLRDGSGPWRIERLAP